MFKAAIAALILVATALPAAATSENDWASFETPYRFAGEVLARDKGLEYWLMPFADHEPSLAQARDMINTMQTVTHLENPLVIKFKLAGVRYDYNTGVNISEDPFFAQVERDLSKIGMQETAMVECTGMYLSEKIPYCHVELEDGVPLQKLLLEKGYVTVAKNSHEVSDSLFPMLQYEEDLARVSEIGIWRPFFFMMRGL